MLLHLCRQDRGCEIRSNVRGGERCCGCDRIALVRQRRGAAPPRRGGLEGLAHVGLHQQGNVARDLAACAGENGERARHLRQPIAMAVPWRLRQRQIEQGGKPLGDVETSVVECGERADRAAELQHERVTAQSPQPVA